MNLMWNQLISRKQSFQLPLPKSRWDPSIPRNLILNNIPFFILLTSAGIISLALGTVTLAAMNHYATITVPNWNSESSSSLEKNFNIYLPQYTVGQGSRLGFYYIGATGAQIVLGSLTILNAIAAFLFGTMGRSSITPRSIARGWTIAAFVNTIAASATIAMTFYENSISGIDLNPPEDHFTIEAWVCGPGSEAVSAISKPGMEVWHDKPAGGEQAVEDFRRFCIQAQATKWLSVIILVFSVLAFVFGIITMTKTEREFQKLQRYNSILPQRTSQNVRNLDRNKELPPYPFSPQSIVNFEYKFGHNSDHLPEFI